MIKKVYDRWSAIFASLPFTVFPSDYFGPMGPLPYVQVSIVVPETKVESYDGDAILPGMVVFQIYSEYGTGETTAIGVVDQLETLLSRTLHGGDLQISTGSLRPIVRDPNNRALQRSDKALQRHDYSLSFTLFGEL